MSTPRLHVIGDQFARPDGSFWTWKGVTDFALLRVQLDEPSWLPHLIQPRLDAGANLFRVLAMKANNTGWELNPVTEGWNGQFHNRYSDAIRDLARILEANGAYMELTVFADTKTIMPDPQVQQRFWQDMCAVVAGHPNVLLELINEAGHHTQSCDPRDFERPVETLASHGSGGSDEQPVHPLWDFGTYHSRRDVPPDTRGFTNYGCYEFDPRWPLPCPYIPDEGCKPENYGYDARWAYNMGLHARSGSGGTFHTSQGVNSLPWPEDVALCATAFFLGLKG